MATVANITAYGAVDGAASSSVAVQAAIDAVEADGGGVVYVPEGTWRCNVQVGDNVSIRGVGRLTSILKSVAGSNIDVIKGKHFAALTNTNPATPETAGDNGLHLSNLCIDGDRDNNTQGYGIRIWGVGHVWTNILVRNCSQDGIHTEFAQEVSTFSGDWGVLEGHFDGIETFHNDGNGWTFLGPHDSWINNFVTYGNGGWGLESRTHVTDYDGVMHGTGWNSFLNTSGSYKLGSSFNLGFVIASGASGIGVDIQPGIADSSIKHLLVGGHATGMILRGANHHISGVFETCSTVAVEFNVTTNCILDLTVDNCAKVFTITNDQGYHTIRANIHLTGAQVLKSGTFGPGVRIDVRDSGGLESLSQLMTNLGVGVASESGKQLLVKGTQATDTVLVARGVGGQSGNLIELQDSAGTAVAKLDVGGGTQFSSVKAIAGPTTNAYLALNSNQVNVIQQTAGAIALVVKGAVSQTGDMQRWLTSADAVLAKIPAAGGLVTQGAALATNATDGFLYIPTCAGTPTGAPTSQTGTVAMIFDTTNNKLYIYDGSWLGGTVPGVFS